MAFIDDPERRPSAITDEPTGSLGSTRGVVPTSQWRIVARRFRRDRPAVVALVVLGLLALSGLLVSSLSPYEVNPTLSSQVLSEARQSPSLQHPFGSDELGRDQLTRVLYGARVSLLVGLCVALASSVIGTAVGAVAGYFGGWVDQVLMRFVDLVLVIPALALVMIAQEGLGRSLLVIVVIFALLFWRTLARIVRALFLSLRAQDFVEAARASGASSVRVIMTEMLPAAAGAICVHLTLAVGAAILAESTLSFLGFGLQSPSVSWGTMLADSRSTVGTDLAYLIYGPGLAILLTVLAVNFVGNGLRGALDPQAAG